MKATVLSASALHSGLLTLLLWRSDLSIELLGDTLCNLLS